MIESFYKKAPYFIKVLMLNLKALFNYRRRFTKEYYQFLNIYNKNWNKSRKEIINFQKDELKKLLLESFEYSEFYKKKFLKNKITKSIILKEPYKALSLTSLLSKTDRKERVETITNQNPKRLSVEIGYTSGTSGSPTKNYQDPESIARSFALWSRFHQTIGFKTSNKSIRFSGRIIINPNKDKPPFWINNYFENQLFMSMYHLNEKNIPSYIDKINKYKPVYLDGYPSAFFAIANHSLKNKVKIKCYIKAICVTAETLYEYQKTIIEDAFGCKVFNQYASSEGSPFITECMEGKLHVNEDSGYFEFLNDKDKPAESGEIARMVVTSFRNLKTPLIRYDIEDNVLLPKKQKTCKCGNHMIYVDEILGRHDDILYTKEKGYIAGMNKAYIGVNGINKSQIIQKDLGSFIIRNIVDENYTASMNKKFLQNLKDRLGEKVDIDIQIVNNIALGPNGKFDAVKREFDINE